MKLLLTLVFTLTLVAADRVDFRRDVRPILSDSCFHCHGPASDTRMAGLRLDVKAEAFAVRKSGAAIVAGNPDQSLILKRILHEKTALRMPPVASHKTVSKAQVETLKRWIEQGADWQEHWSFTAPVKGKLPERAEPRWSANAIDRFLYARLAKEGLSPAAEADRRTLARRVALDATGLPPEPAEVEAFLKDARPDAYEQYVDRMLASPHYGEHRARYWRDTARYADTPGWHIDHSPQQRHDQ